MFHKQIAESTFLLQSLDIVHYQWEYILKNVSLEDFGMQISECTYAYLDVIAYYCNCMSDTFMWLAAR